MKPRIWILGLVAMAGLVVFMPGPAGASSTCSTSTTVCKGQAYVDTTTGGVASTRCFFLDTDAVAGDHACSNTEDRSMWEVAGGSCLTLSYFDLTTGSVPPATPNVVTIQELYDNTATVIATYLNAGVEPANGAAFSFCATSTGNAGGAARAGTYRIFLNAIKNNGAGGVGNYNINSDGTASVGAITQFAKGALRGSQAVSSITASNPPSGTQFAYGPAGNEVETTTAANLAPSGTSEGVETLTVSNQHLNGGSVVDSATSEASTTETLASTIDNKYTLASNAYAGDLKVAGNAQLTSLPWTKFTSTGNGASIVFVSATEVRQESIFQADPRVIFDQPGTNTFATATDTLSVNTGTCPGTTVTPLVFNLGETICVSGFIFNARSQLLSRAMTLNSEDGSANVCTTFGSITPTANRYSASSAIPTSGSCAVTNTLTGSLRFNRVTNTNQNHQSLQTYSVSSLLVLDAHVQLTSALCNTNPALAENCEVTNYIISADTVNGFCHVYNVRSDTNVAITGNGVTFQFIDPTSTVASSGSGNTATGTPNGWAFDGGPPGHNLVSRTQPGVPPGGTWSYICNATDSSTNSGADTQQFSMVSAFSADKQCRLFLTAEPIANVTVTIFLRAEKLQAPVTPDLLPTVVINTTNLQVDAWQIFPQQVLTLRNVVDDTTTVNGALYYGNWTPINSGPVNVLGTCKIQGAPIQQSQWIFVEANTVTTLESATGTNAAELAFMFALIIAVLYVWSRSRDFVIQFLMGLLLFVPFLFWETIFLKNGAHSVVIQGLALICAVVGLYVILRTAWDLSTGTNRKPKDRS